MFTKKTRLLLATVLVLAVVISIGKFIPIVVRTGVIDPCQSNPRDPVCVEQIACEAPSLMEPISKKLVYHLTMGQLGNYKHSVSQLLAIDQENLGLDCGTYIEQVKLYLF